MFKKLICGFVACSVMVGVIGCSNKKEDESKTVIWYLPDITNSSSELSPVLTEFNERLKEKYDLTLDLRLINLGDYDQKMQVINAGREEYDLAFTSNWLNNYYSNVDNGVFADITELLPEYAPNTYNFIDESLWNNIKVDGKVYGVMNWQVQAKAIGVNIPEEKLKKAGMNVDGIKDMNDITEYLSKLIAVEPESNKIKGFWNFFSIKSGIIEIIEQEMPGAIYYNVSGKPTVINQYESPEFLEYVKMRRDWVEKGYSVNMFTPEGDLDSAAKKDIQQVPFIMAVYKPGNAEEVSQSKGYPYVSIPISSAVLSTDGILSAMTGVSSTSRHPETAVKFIEIMNTDEELYNLLAFGLEGIHYNKLSDNKIKITEGSKYGLSNWALGSVANSYVLENQSGDIWEQTKQFNDNAVASPILGFSPDLSDINTEIGNCKTVIKEKLEILELGLIDPEEGVADLVSSLQAAGVDTIVSELQSQIDEWWADNK